MSDTKITKSEIIKIVYDWANFIRKRVLYILIVGALFSLIGFYYSFFSEKKYKAELRFTIKSEGGGAGLTTLVGGLGAMFGGGGLGSTLEKTIEIASSDRILGSVLLTNVYFQGKSDVLGNIVMEKCNLRKQWDSDSAMLHVKFSSSDTSIDVLSFPERRALKVMGNLLVAKSGDGLISRAIDKRSGIVSLTVIHTDEEFSILLVKELFNSLRKFYVEQMVAAPLNNAILFQKKVDSLKSELSKVQYALAKNTDESQALLFLEDKVPLKQLANKEQMLSSLYVEAQKNLETFKFMNDSAIPSFTVIDMPYSPLLVIERNFYHYTIISFLVGVFLMIIFFSLSNIYLDFKEVA